MYKIVLNHISDVEIWPILALLIFLSVFTFMAVRAIRMDKQEANRFASIPLDNPKTPIQYRGGTNDEHK
ncbi:MAG: CcoQ/FixQ family Cbb3-type cytochrome c oxidase assembly chaperone [Calditrichia bacterium]